MNKSPIMEAFENYFSKKPLAFHMPGHKGGQKVPKKILENLLKYDLTEIEGFDNLHFPKEVIKKAQDMMAMAVSSKKSFFLVNGSTGGILASIYSVIRENDKIIVARDCHRSVINALALCGGIAIFVKTSKIEGFGINTGVDIEDLEKCVDENKDAKAIFVTSPTFYGVCSNIDRISEISKKNNMILIVDEAHGAHFPFSNKLPKSAVEVGADMVVQSAHKTLICPNQAAYLNINGHNVDEKRLVQALSMFQTTSPSYVLLLFLDYARAFLQAEGREYLENAIKYCDEFRDSFNGYDRFKVLSKDNLHKQTLDPTRIVLNTFKANITGYDMDKFLRKDYNIYAEMSDLQNVVFIVSLVDDKENLNILERAIKAICVSDKKPFDCLEFDTRIPDFGIKIKDALNADDEYVFLTQSVGRICKYILTPYPPGIASICPGEIIDAKAVDFLKQVKLAGGSVDGLNDDGKIAVVKF